ncbi:MAG: hypothetical protein ABUL62_16960 [Myxococcales bacterium]
MVQPRLADTNPAEHAPLAASAPLRRIEHEEGSFTRVIEQQTAKVPSHVFLTAALLAMAASALLEARGKERASRFIGQWPAPLLVMGLYNKFVKSFGTR